MSLTNFIKQPEIATKLRRLHVELVGERKADECAHEDAPATTIALRGKSYRVVRRVKTDEGKARYKAAKITTTDGQRIPIKVEARSKNTSLVGTAFDYLLRFELQRRAPHAISQPWVAEKAAKDPGRHIGLGKRWADLNILKNGNWKIFSEGDAPLGSQPVDMQGRIWIESGEITRRVGIVLKNAKAAVDAYSQQKHPTPTEQAALAAHAVRLAKLDSVLRGPGLVPDFEEAASEDVQDLVDLLAITPFNDLLHNEVVLLNPTFGEAARPIGGADADLIIGDMLVDIKTTKDDTIQVQHLNQLLGYFLLARKERTISPAFPVINRFGLYYSRYGYLYSFDASAWTEHPEFLETEKWFFSQITRIEAARQAFRADPAAFRARQRSGQVPVFEAPAKKDGRASHQTERSKVEQAYLLDHCAVCRSIAKTSGIGIVSWVNHNKHECRCQHGTITFSAQTRDDVPDWLRPYWDKREALTYQATTSEGLPYKACKACKNVIL